MNRIEFELQTKDNLKLFGHSWQPDTEAAKAGKHVELKIWEEMYHELHNEKIKDEVFEYIINWLKKQELA